MGEARGNGGVRVWMCKNIVVHGKIPISLTRVGAGFWEEVFAAHSLLISLLTLGTDRLF